MIDLPDMPIWFGVAKSVRYDRWGVAIWRE